MEKKEEMEQMSDNDGRYNLFPIEQLYFKLFVLVNTLLCPSNLIYFTKLDLFLNRAENFKMVDIEIKA